MFFREVLQQQPPGNAQMDSAVGIDYFRHAK